MFTYFNDFISGFLGIENAVITTVISQMLCVCLALCIIYLLTKLVFPKDGIVKRSVFIVLFVCAILTVLYANGFTLISVTQTLAQMGGV